MSVAPEVSGPPAPVNEVPEVSGADASPTDIRRALMKLLAGVDDLSTRTVGTIRGDVASALGLMPDGLEARRDEVADITHDVIQAICSKTGKPHRREDDLGAENNCSKTAYLVTFSRPKVAEAGPPLKAPGDLSREGIRDCLLEAVEATNQQKYQPLFLEKMVVFRERHEDGDIHYHVAVLGSRGFRFGPLKRHLRAVAQLASHWSVSHNTYWSCVSYGFWPSPHKPEDELDPIPLPWAREGDHPPLAEAARQAISAQAVSDHRLQVAKRRAEEGKAEQKFRDIDLWPVVVNESIQADARATNKIIEYAKKCGGRTMVEWVFQNEPRLPDVVARCWRFEQATDAVTRDAKPRVAILEEARSKPCSCEGRWTVAAMPFDTACALCMRAVNLFLKKKQDLRRRSYL